MKTRYLLPLAFTALIASCSNDDITPTPQAPPATITYTAADSMQVAPIAAGINPQFYADVHGKIYTVTGIRNSAAFAERYGDLLIQFNDSSVAGYTTTLSIKLKSKTLTTASGTYQLAGNNGICIEMGQELTGTGSGSSWALSLLCETVKQGVLQLSYDAATQTLSGRIDKVQYGIGFYLPAYFAGKPHSLAEKGFISSGGSTRTQTIVFANVRRGK